jgi:hypothetical protein
MDWLTLCSLCESEMAKPLQDDDLLTLIAPLLPPRMPRWFKQ